MLLATGSDRTRLMASRSILGFPRMGVNRDLKKATEAYWAGKLSQEDLLAEGKRLRLAHWKLQKDAGVDIIPSNDFSYYDHVLDHIQLFGVSLVSSQTTIASQSLYRLHYQGTPSTALTPLTNSSQWVEDTRSPKQMMERRQLMYRVWYVSSGSPSLAPTFGLTGL